MKDTTVAARYARALFIVTEKRKETAQALDDLKGMWQVLAPGTPVGRLLDTPLVLLADKRRVILQVLEKRCLRSVALFIDLLLRKTRLKEFETIVHEFEALVEKQQGIQRAQLTSAVPVADAELKRLHVELERYTKSKIRLSTDVDPRLLGGAMVRIGDHVIDRSVRSLLDAIEQQLMDVSV